jgi:hypothetical protein
MKKVDFQFDMYPIFDRIGDGVKFDYTIEYNLKDLFKNGFTDNNFVVIPKGMDSTAKRYLSSYHMSVAAWEHDAIDYITKDNNQTAIEVFGEWLAANADDETNAAWDKLFE